MQIVERTSPDIIERPIKVGIVLTAGNRGMEPDPIGYHRLHTAIHQLNDGNQDTLIVAGGGGYEGNIPFATIYKQAAIEDTLIHTQLLSTEEQGVETVTDLRSVVRHMVTTLHLDSPSQLNDLVNFTVFSELDHANEGVEALKKLGVNASAFDTLVSDESGVYTTEYFGAMEKRGKIMGAIKFMAEHLPWGINKRLDLGNLAIATIALHTRVPKEKRQFHSTR